MSEKKSLRKKFPLECIGQPHRWITFSVHLAANNSSIYGNPINIHIKIGVALASHTI